MCEFEETVVFATIARDGTRLTVTLPLAQATPDAISAARANLLDVLAQANGEPTEAERQIAFARAIMAKFAA